MLSSCLESNSNSRFEAQIPVPLSGTSGNLSQSRNLMLGSFLPSWPLASSQGAHHDREPSEPFVPKMRRSSSPAYLQLPLAAGPAPEQEWLSKHECDYRGDWVALDGERLVAHGTDGKVVFRQAKAAGVPSPFLVFIEQDPLPSGGW